MNSAVIAFFTCLLVLCAQGQPASRSSKCKCINGYISRVSRKIIRGEPVIHHPSIFCLQTEIIITIRNNHTYEKKCVNPQSPLGQYILKNKNKHGKKQAVSTTTTSDQTTTTVNSPRLHTTSKL